MNISESEALEHISTLCAYSSGAPSGGGQRWDWPLADYLEERNA